MRGSCIFIDDRGNTRRVREIKHCMEACRARIAMLSGRDLVVVVNRGRNKVEKFRGKIRDMYDAVFTVEGEGGVSCFSYSDVLTKSVRFLDGTAR